MRVILSILETALPLGTCCPHSVTTLNTGSKNVDNRSATGGAEQMVYLSIQRNPLSPQDLIGTPHTVLAPQNSFGTFQLSTMPALVIYFSILGVEDLEHRLRWWFFLRLRILLLTLGRVLRSIQIKFHHHLLRSRSPLELYSASAWTKISTTM